MVWLTQPIIFPASPVHPMLQQRAALTLCSSTENAGERPPIVHPLLPEHVVRIGKDADSDILIQEAQYPAVSRHHAEIKLVTTTDAVEWQLCDCNSANGTYVNGMRISGCQILKSGDRIQITREGPEFLFECQVVAYPPSSVTPISADPSPVPEASPFPTLPSPEKLIAPAPSEMSDIPQPAPASVPIVSTQPAPIAPQPPRSLWNLSSAGDTTVLNGHTEAVRAIAFSPNRSMLASAGAEKVIRLWDIAKRETIATFSGHKQVINAVAFSPDGQILASVSADKTIRLWEVPTGQEVRSLPGHTAGVNTVAFSLDGQQLVSGGADKAVRIWEVASGAEVRSLMGHKMPVTAVAWYAGSQIVEKAGTGGIIASASADRAIKLWDGVSGEELNTLTGLRTVMHTLVFSPDGAMMAIAGDDRILRLWDLKANQEVNGLPIPPWQSGGFAISVDGILLAGSDSANAVRIWGV